MHGLVRAAALATVAWVMASSSLCFAEPPKFWSTIKNTIIGPPKPEAASLPPLPPMSPPPPNVVAPSSSGSVVWYTYGKSLDGRSLEYTQIGSGEHHVLVVGSLVGTEPEGVAVAESLADHLTRFPQRIDNLQVTIVRNPNPDGMAKRTAGNARGVLLDRNFLTVGWRRLGDKNNATSGREPESEPESKALADLFGDVRPERVIILSTTTGQGTLRFVGPAETLARQVARDGELKLVQNDPQQASGSLATYSGTDRGLATMVFGFVPRVTAGEIFLAHKRALLTAVSGVPAVEPPAVANGSPATYLPPTTPTLPPMAPLQPVTMERPVTPSYLPNSMALTPPPASYYDSPQPPVLSVGDAPARRPMVPVVLPGAEGKTVATPNTTPMLPASSRSLVPSMPDPPETRIKRLPPLGAIAPGPILKAPINLPQAPIATYPETGLP